MQLITNLFPICKIGKFSDLFAGTFSLKYFQKFGLIRFLWLYRNALAQIIVNCIIVSVTVIQKL